MPRPAARSHSTQPPPADARDCALRWLAMQAARFPTLDIAPLDAAGLPAREQALAHAIADAVLERWLSLEAVLNAFLKRPLRAAEPASQAALLGGAAQLLLLDRIPEHAAIDESVRWVKRAARPSAGGLVNGVLRNLGRALERDSAGAIARRESFAWRPDELPLGAGAIGFNRALLPEEEVARTSAQVSLSPWLVRRWLAEDPRRARARMLHTLADAPITLNVAHAAALPQGTHIQAHAAPGSAIFTGSRAELTGLLAEHPDIWVQDAASAAPIAQFQPARPPRLIADVCAGSGTKTRQLAARFPEAEIIASDPDSARSAALGRIFAGAARVRVMAPDEARAAALGRADLVLLDVPCTNTGVLGRRPEARYRAGQSQLERLCGIQRQIIADAIPLLAPASRGGGVILYATCSLEPEENERQAAWVRQWHRCSVAPVVSVEPAGLPGEAAAGYRDGAYAVALGGFG